jgi:hypothetical protein
MTLQHIRTRFPSIPSVSLVLNRKPIQLLCLDLADVFALVVSLLRTRSTCLQRTSLLSST